jgi:hypothetical protein
MGCVPFHQMRFVQLAECGAFARDKQERRGVGAVGYAQFVETRLSGSPVAVAIAVAVATGGGGRARCR